MAAAQASPAGGSAPAAAGFDIVGVRIGMSEAEARAALLTLDPDLRIKTVMSAYNYQDGASMLTTREFLDRLEAKTQGRSEQGADATTLEAHASAQFDGRPVHGFEVCTLNIGPFVTAGVPVIDPW